MPIQAQKKAHLVSTQKNTNVGKDGGIMVESAFLRVDVVLLNVNSRIKNIVFSDILIYDYYFFIQPKLSPFFK